MMEETQDQEEETFEHAGRQAELLVLFLGR